MDRNHLQILLELAYRGDAALGGGCRDERCDGCGACESFTEAEREVYGRLATSQERNWWTGGRWFDRLQGVRGWTGSRIAALRYR